MRTRAPVSADLIAASTIARLRMFACTSVDGASPVRSDATNSASTPARSSGPAAIPVGSSARS